MFSGERRRSPRPVDLGRVLRSPVAVAGLSLPTRRKSRARLRVAMRVPRRLPRVLGDARDAMPAGGAITVTVTAGPLFVTVSVRDQGPGIPVEYLERVFEPRRCGAGRSRPLARRNIDLGRDGG